MLALHGDGGAIKPLVRAWRSATAEASAILVAPACPRALGCSSRSFWKWFATSQHDPAWLGAQIDAVAARFPVDLRRVYATGYSGGATYLGWYAPAFATRFAAVAHVAGGMPYGGACPACKLPVLFVLGKTDPMIEPYTRPLRDWYAGCGGHEIVWETLPGVTHDSILQVLEAGRARTVLGWLLEHRSCTDAADAGAHVEEPPDASVDAAEPGSVVKLVTPSDPPRAAPPPAPRCACEVASSDERGTASGLAAALAALALGLRRRR